MQRVSGTTIPTCPKANGDEAPKMSMSVWAMFTNNPAQVPRRAVMIVSDTLMDADIIIAEESDSAVSWKFARAVALA